MEEMQILEQQLQEQLEEVRSYEKTLTEQIEKLQREREGLSDSTDKQEYYNERNKLVNALDDESMRALQNRQNLFNKESKRKKIRIALFSLYLIASGVVLYLIDTLSWRSYMIAALVGVAVIGIPFTISIKMVSKQYDKTLDDPRLREFDIAAAELYDNFKQKSNEKRLRVEELRSEEFEIDKELKETQKIEAQILSRIENLEFNFEYRDTILFYGMERNNRYGLYLDGRLYDTVRGKQIIRIVMTPGLHSFKVTNTCYNIDKSIIYSYEFNTVQFVAGEEAAAHAIVCEYNKIREVEGAEFQQITKTRLI